MPPVQVICPHCSSANRIDSERLPDQPIKLPCPSCSGEIVLDKGRLLADTAPPEPAGAQAPAPPGAAAPTEPTVEPKELLLPPNFSIPEGTTLPSGVLIGDPASDTVAALRAALDPWGAKLVPVADAETVRRMDDLPELVVYAAGQVGAFPYEPLTPLRTLPAQERRRTFVVLIADDLKTLDGNEAFLYQVNLIMNRAEVELAAELLYTALDFHRRLYGHLLAAEDAALMG